MDYCRCTVAILKIILPVIAYDFDIRSLLILGKTVVGPSLKLAGLLSTLGVTTTVGQHSATVLPVLHILKRSTAAKFSAKLR